MMEQELLDALAPAIPWQACYPAVAAAVRHLLDEADPGASLTTVQVAYFLLPPSRIDCVERIAAKKRLFKALSALAAHDLAAYATRGEPKRGKGRYSKKMVRPWIWHKPTVDTSDRRSIEERLRQMLWDIVDRLEAPTDWLLLKPLLEEAKSLLE